MPLGIRYGIVTTAVRTIHCNIHTITRCRYACTIVVRCRSNTRNCYAEVLLAVVVRTVGFVKRERTITFSTFG